MKRYRGWIFILLLMSLVWSVCERRFDDSSINESTNKQEIPSQEGWNSQIIVTESGRKQAVIWYGHMLEYDERKMVYLDSVEVEFFDEEGNMTSHLTSHRGEYNTATQDVIGIGHVVVVSDTGRLETEHLRWDNRTEKILSDTTVLFISMDMDSLWGKGFESESDLRRMVVYQPRAKSSQYVDFEKAEEEMKNPRQVKSENSDSTGKK